MTTAFVSPNEYQDFIFKSNKNNLIKKFWIKILALAPKHLKLELKNKRSDLVKQSGGEFNITGAVPYQFETINATKELADYLNSYIVFVEHDSPEIIKWKHDIHTLNQLRHHYYQSLKK